MVVVHALFKLNIGYNILLGVMSSGFILSTNQSVISILFKTEYSPKYILASSVGDRDFEPRSGQTKNYKLAFVASPLSTPPRSIKQKEQRLIGSESG